MSNRQKQEHKDMMQLLTYSYYSECARQSELERDFLRAAELWKVAMLLARHPENTEWARCRLDLCEHLHRVSKGECEHASSLPVCYLKSRVLLCKAKNLNATVQEA
jgi:hypothetical protein